MASNRSYGATLAPSAPAIPINTVTTGIPTLPATIIGNVTTEQPILSPGSPMPLTILIPPGTPLEQRTFEIQASGQLKTNAATNVTIKLYSGSSATLGSDVLVGSSGAVAQTGAVPWFLRGSAVYDSVSGKMTGILKFVVNNAITAEAPFTAILTGISNANALGQAVASFLLTATFSVASPLNFLTVQEFAINF
jgi:hypothetical protein